MNRLISLLGVAALIAIGGCGAPPEDDVSVDAGRFIQAALPVGGQYIVVLNDDAVADVDSDVADLGARYQGDVFQTYRHALKGFAARMTPAMARGLLKDPRVAYVEEDGVVEAWTTQSGATWGIDRIDQRNLPLSGTYTYNVTGSGVHAYIIDTGILGTHTQFTGRMGSGYTAIRDGNGTTDCAGHGTHVSGTVGGSTYGVAKGVTLHPVRVLDCSGSGSNSGVIAGVDWVRANAIKPAVANMSLGGSASSTLDTSVSNAIASGVVFAIAAGNDNANACNYSPARVASAITVGATTNTDARASYSNYGTCLDIFAPGSSITSAWYTSTTATNTISGTSMATPHVCGAAALYLSANPSATPAAVRDALVNNATANVVTSAGTGSPNKLLYTLFIGGGTPPANDFSISASPTSRTVTQGSGTTYTISTAVTSGSAQTVSFSASGVPSGASASFSPTSVSAGGSSTFTVNTSTSTPTGTYNITVTGTGSSATHATTVTLVVSSSGGGSCTTNSQLLLNPGFESGANGQWTTSSGVIDSSTSAPARSGSYKAWLDGYGTSHTDYMYQTVTIPSGACSATLSFYLYITTAETTTSTAYDKLTVTVRNPSTGATLATLATYSNLNKSSGYVLKSFDLAAYKGQQIRIYFNGVEDSSLQTSFLVDDTALNVTQ